MGRDFTPHQQRIIRSYYRNLDAIRAQRLQELVTELWLADTPRKRERLWTRARDLLQGRKDEVVPPEVEKVLADRDVEGLARIAARDA